MEVELIRFHKKYRLYSRLLLRSEGFRDQRYVYAYDVFPIIMSVHVHTVPRFM